VPAASTCSERTGTDVGHQRVHQLLRATAVACVRCCGPAHMPACNMDGSCACEPTGAAHLTC
jgi:hypothetical protein